MESENPLTYLAAQQYFELDRGSDLKHDFVDGEIFAMAGVLPAHALIAANVAAELGERLRGARCLVFSSDLRVCLDPNRLITYPDVTVVCNQPQYFDAKQDTITNPLLVVEVISPSTEDYDRGKKGYMYRQVGSVKEYLLIAQDHVSVECYRPMQNGHWELGL